VKEPLFSAMIVSAGGLTKFMPMASAMRTGSSTLPRASSSARK
jgi:hypothetical protein